MRNLILLLILCLGSSTASFAQDFSNKGKDFWIAYTGHIDATASVMGLYLTSDVAASGTVKVGGTTLPFSITAGQVTTLFIGPGGAVSNATVYNPQSDEIGSDRGIHVVSTKDIVVYAHIIRSARSGATLVLPTPVLGRDYIVPSHNNRGNGGANSGYGQITVVAVEDNTTIEITPTVPDRSGFHPPSAPFTVTLPTAGDVYQLQSQQNADFSGSKVKSISTGGATCKPIAVFSSTTWSGFDCANASGGDNLYQQLFPTKSWGKKFVTAPFINKPYDIIRVFVQDAATVVNMTDNGVTSTLSGLAPGDYYEVKTNRPLVLEASQPVSVAQYITSQSCGGSNSDPEMTLINPVEQTLDKITLFSAHQNFVPPGQTNVNQHFINVVIPTSHKGTFRIDNNLPAGTFVDIAGTGYSYLQENVTLSSAANPVHTLLADTGFTAIVYGYGNVESYGYNAGTNVRDLYQFIGVQNEYATVNFPATCVGSPFYFSMTFPYQPTQIQWQFSGLFPDVTLTNPVFDSTWVVNGRTLYRYKLPTPYTINTVGTYPITVVAQNPSADGCGNTQEISYDLEVFGRPTAAFTFATTGCLSDSVRFTDVSNVLPREITRWNWNFGDGGTSAIKNPAHLYNTGGTFNAKLSVVTDVGCVSDTAVRPVTINIAPSAKFGVSGLRCAAQTLSFSDSSTSAAMAPITKWTWNFGDGSPVVVASTNVNQNHIYTTPGTYTATLVVETATGCRSTVFSFPVVIDTKPTASFSAGNGCLPNATITFTNSSTVSSGTLTYLWNFGDGGTSTLQNPTHTFTTAGPFTVTLTATSSGGCIDDTVQTISASTISPQPLSTFTVNKESVCPGESFQFTSTATAPGGTVAEWFWNFGDGTTSTLQNPTKTYSLTGTYTVYHIVKSSSGCVSDTTRATVNVYPSPTAAFTFTGNRCAGSAITFTSTSVSNVGGVAITGYNWFVNGTASGTGATFVWTPATDGTFNIRLSITTAGGCSDDSTVAVVVSPKPAPNFNAPVICMPAGTATFTNTTTISDGTLGTVTYLWNFGDGGTSTATNPTHTYTGTGPYNVTLTATSAGGCAESITKPLNTIFPQPIAAFTHPADVCLGASVTFTDGSTASGSTVTGWAWTFDDGTTSSVQNPVKTFTTASLHTASLVVTSAAGCQSAPVTRTVTVSALPLARFGADAPTCAGQAITFSDRSTTSTGSIVKWTWTMGDGTPATDRTSAAPFMYTYAAAGSYTVSLRVETDKGCVSTLWDSIIRVAVLPAPGFTLPETCVSDPFAQFTNTSTSSDGSALTYLWNFGDANATPGNPNTSTLRDPQHRYTGTGVYTVSLTVTNASGCSEVLTQAFTVNGGLPQSSFTLSGGAAQCSGDSVTVVSNSSVVPGSVVKLEIFWDPSDPTQVTLDDDPIAGQLYRYRYPAFTTPTSRTVSIRVRAYSGATCFDDSVQTITLGARPSILLSPTADFCAGDPSRRLSATVTNVTGTGVFSGRGVSPDGTFDPAVAGAGAHTIRYTFTSAAGCRDSAQQTVTVNAIPAIRLTPNRVMLAGGSITLDADVTGSGLGYLWTPATGLSSATVLRPIASPLVDTRYTLTVTGPGGCNADSSVLVKILEGVAIPNVFSPNGDGVHDTWVLSALDSYPGATVEIYNRYGQMVFRSNGYTRPWDGRVNGKDAPIGTYYYLINPKNGRKQLSGYVDLIR